MSTEPILAPRMASSGFSTSLALLVLRLALAWVFILAGGGKLFGWFGGWGIQAFAQSPVLQSLPVFPPIVWAYMAALGEFVGGVSMLLGLVARAGAIPLIVVMFVAIAKVHGPNGFSGVPVKGMPGAMYPGYVINMLIVAMSLAILLAGPGLISLDALLFKRGCCPGAPRPLAEPQK